MIPFNKPHLFGNEFKYMRNAYINGQLSGDGDYTKMCSDLLVKKTNTTKALITHSCTAALEMTALLLDLKPGDEFITTSYTFVSTVNAFILRGAIPRFVDIRCDTLNIDEKLIERKINYKTKAIVVVHYAGVACEMDFIIALAKKYKLPVIEDAAQAISSTYKGKPLGSIGDFGTLSFHETKNVIAGEGGALLINNKRYVDRAEVIREKGTNRKKFLNGEIDKYSWIDLGSSYLPGEIVSAFLLAQLENLELITELRRKIWNIYHSSFLEYEGKGKVQLPFIPIDCKHNAHLYYLIFPTNRLRNEFLDYMKRKGVNCVFHYVPLHSSPYSKKLLKEEIKLSITEDYSTRLVRLPLWIGLENKQDYIISKVIDFLNSI